MIPCISVDIFEFGLNIQCKIFSLDSDSSFKYIEWRETLLQQNEHTLGEHIIVSMNVERYSVLLN